MVALIAHRTFVLSSHTVAEAQAELTKAGQSAGGVIHEGQVVGIVSLPVISQALGGRYGYSLHSRQPVLNYAIRDALVVGEQDDLVEVIERVLSRPVERLSEDVAVARASGEFAGLINVPALVQLQVQMLKQRSRALEQQQDLLQEQNRELRELTSRLDAANQDLASAKEKAEEATKMKSIFLANMSHEIRTPMNAVLGFLELLADSPLNAGQRDYLTTARSSAESLLTIINDILDFTRIESGRLRVEQVAFEWQSIAEQVMAGQQPGIAVDKVKLLATFGSAGTRQVIGDPMRFRQILTNLLGNAVKFTETGKIELRAFMVEIEGVASLRFEIHDTGIGIPSAALPKLFSPFTQVDGSSTRQFGGTGLGLAICKQLVELMKGRIGAESVPGCGSCFWFVLPAIVVTPAFSVVASGTHDLAGTATRMTGKVLVVEDNEFNRRLVQAILLKCGCEVDCAENGLLALGKLESESYDLVLMDLQMPEMDGLAATCEIRRLAISNRAGTGRVPVVALTANVLDEDRRRCFEVGMDAFTGKPVKQSELLAILVQFVNPASRLAAAKDSLLAALQ